VQADNPIKSDKVDADDEDDDPRIEAFCRLWDLSINSNNCDVMYNLDIIQIIETILTESAPTPRTKELCFGIIANMAAIPRICDQLCHSPAILRSLVEIIMTSTDPAPISEALRFLAVGIVHLGKSGEPTADADAESAAIVPADGGASADGGAAAAGGEGGACSLESILDDPILLNQVAQSTPSIARIPPDSPPSPPLGGSPALRAGGGGARRAPRAARRAPRAQLMCVYINI
jgi:hypothetical protein